MFRPSKEQIQAKSKFQNKIKNNPLLGELDKLPEVRLATLAGVKDIGPWLQQDGFKEWLLNDNSVQELAEIGLELSMRELIEDITLGAMSTKDKIAAMKLLLDLARPIFLARLSADAKKTVGMDFAAMSEDSLNEHIISLMKQQEVIKEEFKEVQRPSKLGAVNG